MCIDIDVYWERDARPKSNPANEPVSLSVSTRASSIRYPPPSPPPPVAPGIFRLHGEHHHQSDLNYSDIFIKNTTTTNKILFPRTWYVLILLILRNTVDKNEGPYRSGQGGRRACLVQWPWIRVTSWEGHSSREMGWENKKTNIIKRKTTVLL